MAKNTNFEDAVERHVEYPDLKNKNLLTNFQQTRLKCIYGLVPSGSKVLDIGCNSGYLAEMTEGCDCYGVDVAPALIEIASKVINAQVAPAENLPFEDNFFDVSILGEILEHVYDPEAVVKEAVRVTKFLVVGSTPHERSDWGHNGQHKVVSHKYHVRCFTSQELALLLGKHGILKITPFFDKHKRPQMNVFELDLAETDTVFKEALEKANG
jgi:ubiquinone/menaquinone biosynthesis C-methylase UbiE